MSAVRYSGNVIIRLSLTRMRGDSGKVGWFYRGKLRAPGGYFASGILSPRECGVRAPLKSTSAYDRVAASFLELACSSSARDKKVIEKNAVLRDDEYGVLGWEILRVQQAPCPMEKGYM